MTPKANGSSWSGFTRAIAARKTLFIGGLAVLLAIAVFGRSHTIRRALHRLNLRTYTHYNAMARPQAGEKMLVFAPHPDDETLGCGGLIQQAVQAGSSVKVILMTNGEYPEIDVVLFEETVRFSKAAFVRLGEMRKEESLRALSCLGLSPDDVTFLGYPNFYLSDMWLPAHWQPQNPIRSVRTRSTQSPYPDSMTKNTVYCGQSALRDVETVLLREKPNAVFTLHPNDVHPDHWPTYALVRYALEELSARGDTFAKHVRLYTYLIHRDSWPTQRGFRPGSPLEPPFSLTLDGQTDWRELPLSAEQTTLKHKATGMYRTQAGTIDPLLRSFARTNELFGVVPILTWENGSVVPSTTVIVDPQSDLVSSTEYKHGDISHVSLGRNGDRMTVEVATRGTAAATTGYHLSIHAGRADESDRVIAEYDWQGSAASGLLCSDGDLRVISPAQLSADFSQSRSTIEAPWPMKDRKQTFFMIRAWTTRGKHVTDQTATATYRIAALGR